MYKYYLLPCRTINRNINQKINKLSEYIKNIVVKTSVVTARTIKTFLFFTINLTVHFIF